MDKLVNYSSSSSSEAENEQPPPKKIKKLLPMPFEAAKKTVTDDSSQHEGRKRLVEHVDGNWASHIFIELHPDILSKLKDFTSELEDEDIKPVESPHVSISKMFILKHHWIDNFFKMLSATVTFEMFNLEISPSVAFLSNENKSRHFACILLEESCKSHLQSLVNKIDKSLLEFQLPTYYEESIFHISVLWKLTEFSDEEKSEISARIKRLMSEDLNFYTKVVDKLIFKTGNKIKILNAL